MLRDCIDLPNVFLSAINTTKSKIFNMSLGPNFLGKTPGPESGPFSAVANITAKSESDLKEIIPLLLAVQKNANSNNEPDCTEVGSQC